LPFKVMKKPLKIRHYIPLIFVLSFFLLLILSFFNKIFFFGFGFLCALYFLAVLYFSFKIALSKKRLGYVFVMPLSFINRHFGYGLGELYGILGLLLK
jgi:hypothetical protein